MKSITHNLIGIVIILACLAFTFAVLFQDTTVLFLSVAVIILAIKADGKYPAPPKQCDRTEFSNRADEFLPFDKD